MNFLLAMLLFLPAPASPVRDSTVARQNRAQVRHYVQSLQHRQSVALNLWALTEVGRGAPAIRSYTRRYLRRHPLPGGYRAAFRDSSLSYPARLRKLAFAARSPALLVAALLAEPDSARRRAIATRYARRFGYPQAGNIRYAALVQAVLQGRPVTRAMLPAEIFQPLHFFLIFLYRPKDGHAFAKKYLQKITNQWHLSGPASLKKIVKSMTLYDAIYNSFQYDRTEPLYQSIADDRLFPNGSLKLKIFRSLDYSMYRLGYYNRSLELIRHNSLPLARYLGDERNTLKLRIAQAAYIYYLGKINEAKKAYQRLLADSTVTRKKYISKARLHNNLAIDYWKNGEFNHYLNIEFKALRQAEKEQNYGLHFDILINLFIYYRTNKDYDSAKQYLSKAQKLARENQKKEDLAQIEFYRGQLYRDAESNYGKAIQSFNQALGRISYGDHYRIYQNILTDKARLLEKQQKYLQAVVIYQRILLHARKRNDPRNLLYAAFNKANTYLEQGLIDSARVMMDTLKTAPLKPLDFYQLVKAKTMQARYRAQTGRPKQGIRQLQPVIGQILKRSRQSGDVETGFWQVEPKYLDAFQLYADLLIRTHQPARAVEALDRLKTINNAGLYHSELLRARALNEKQLSQYKRLTSQLDELRRQLLVAKKSDRKKIQQQIDERSAKKNALNKKVNARRPRKPVSVRRIQRRLNAHERVLHLTDLNDTFYLAVISRTAVHFKKIPITPKIRRQFKHSIKQLATGNPDLTRLYRFTKLLELDKLPSQVQKLTIIPDSYLYQLPLDVLPLDPPDGPFKYGTAHYLVEQLQTRYMTSLNDFNKKQVPDHYKYNFVGYGVSRFSDNRPNLQPLPHARAEVQAVAGQLPKLNHKKIFLDNRATISTFKRTAPHARILHLATHSRVNSNNPLFSTIYLRRSPDSAGTNKSGRIFAYQLFNLHLSNELVMLNSCESGSGSYLQGTGVVGISRALRYAGARSLVLNLWSVNDMFASEMATRFYHYIDEGNNKAAALRKARLHFLQNSSANPHFWGSYMLLGNDEAIIKLHQKTNRMAAAAFMLFFFSVSIASSLLQYKRR